MVVPLFYICVFLRVEEQEETHTDKHTKFPHAFAHAYDTELSHTESYSSSLFLLPPQSNEKSIINVENIKYKFSWI